MSRRRLLGKKSTQTSLDFPAPLLKRGLLSRLVSYLNAWNRLVAHRFSLTSLRFFEMNPDYQRLFPEFKDVDPVELENTSALYGHAKRVMKAVENAVSSLDDAFSFAAYLEELGRRHIARALKPSYLDVSITKL